MQWLAGTLGRTRRALVSLACAASFAAVSAHAQAPKPTTTTAPAAAATEEDKDTARLSDLTGPTETPTKTQGIAYYEELVKKTPDDAQAHQLLGAAYMRQGKYDDARREIRRAIELDATNAELQQAAGLVEEGAGNLGAALEAIGRAKAMDGNVEFRLDYARILYLQAKTAEAQAEMDKIAGDFKANADVQLALADALKGVGRYDDAAAAYERALALATPGSPTRIATLVEEARMYADRGSNREALDLFTRARTEDPKDADVHYNLGVLYVRLNRPDAAVASFQEAVNLDKDMEKAHNNMGVAYEKLGRLPDAAAAFDKAVKASPKFLDALYNLGLVNFKMRKFKEARAAFEKALTIQPDMGDAKSLLAEIYYQLGEPKKAMQLYKEAVRSNAEDAGSHRRLGDLYLEQGDLSLAIGEYWAAVDSDENDVDNRAQLMRALLARNDDGDGRRAVKLGEDGLKHAPTALDVRLALAEAEIAQGRSPRAEQLLVEGTKVSPQEPRVWVSLGRFYLDQSTEGSVQRAKQQFEQAMKLDPQNAAAIAADGEAHYTLGDKEKAKQRFKDALAIDGTLADARADLGRLMYEEGNNADALKELKRATQDAPKLGKAWFYLAFAQNKDGQGPAVVEKSLKKAVENQPDLAEAHLQLGLIAEKLNRNADACKSFLAAIAARPSYEEALVRAERLNCNKLGTQSPAPTTP